MKLAKADLHGICHVNDTKDISLHGNCHGNLSCDLVLTWECHARDPVNQEPLILTWESHVKVPTSYAQPEADRSWGSGLRLHLTALIAIN